MFILSSISSGLEFWLVSHTSMYENSESKVFKNVKHLGEISSNWPNDLFGANVYKTLEFCWWLLMKVIQWTNNTSVISKEGTFSPFSFFVILLLVLPSNFIVLGVKSSR